MKRKINSIKKDTPFLVTITVPEGKASEWITFVYTEKFPYEEIDGTGDVIKTLLFEHKLRQRMEP